jgi:hypothetical protein
MAETVRSSATRGANCEPIDATTTSGQAGHDPERWTPVLGEDHVPIKIQV